MAIGTHRDKKKGRGAQLNPQNRFAAQSVVKEHIESIDDWEEALIETEVFEERPRQIVNKIDSPDVGMFYSVNPYQGCEHGCVYCYARNTHEYWGYSAGLDFESKIIMKKNAPELLNKWFQNPKWKPMPISFSGNTDCYQPLERKFKITRQLLETCLKYRNPCGIITKNALVLRDLDILKELADLNLVKVIVSITTMDESLRRIMEPRTVTTEQRLDIIEKLNQKGIPTGIMTAPIIPGINNHEIPQLIKAAGARGAQFAGYTVVRLNGAVKIIFKDWLMKHFPDRADKVWHQIEECHGGSVQDARFGTRMSGEGVFAENIAQMHALACKKYLPAKKISLDTTIFRRPGESQLTLFG